MQKLESWVCTTEQHSILTYINPNIEKVFAFTKNLPYKCGKSFRMVCSCAVFITHTRALAEDTCIILSLSFRALGLLNVLVHGEIVPQKWFGSSIEFFFHSIQKEACLCKKKKTHSNALLKYLLWCFVSDCDFTLYADKYSVHTIKSNHRTNMWILWCSSSALYLWQSFTSVLTNTCLARNKIRYRKIAIIRSFIFSFLICTIRNISNHWKAA